MALGTRVVLYGGFGPGGFDRDLKCMTQPSSGGGAGALGYFQDVQEYDMASGRS